MRLKKEISALLLQPDQDAALAAIRSLPARQAVNPLFSFFYSGEETVRWRAIVAMGAVVSDLAADEIESARVVMRRLIWNLNDESGGIGWGSPEAMGEITARSRRLAREYAAIIVSYIRTDGNYLEHEGLQRGALWALGRLAHVHPDLTRDAQGHLAPYLGSKDPWLRGLAAWAAGGVGDRFVGDRLEVLTEDNAPLNLFIDGALQPTTVGQLAVEALAQLNVLDFRGDAET